jgi:hypothetical protein
LSFAFFRASEKISKNKLVVTSLPCIERRTVQDSQEAPLLAMLHDVGLPFFCLRKKISKTKDALFSLFSYRMILCYSQDKT